MPDAHGKRDADIKARRISEIINENVDLGILFVFEIRRSVKYFKGVSNALRGDPVKYRGLRGVLGGNGYVEPCELDAKMLGKARKEHGKHV